MLKDWRAWAKLVAMILSLFAGGDLWLTSKDINSQTDAVGIEVEQLQARVQALEGQNAQLLSSNQILLSQNALLTVQVDRLTGVIESVVRCLIVLGDKTVISGGNCKFLGLVEQP